MFGYFFFCKKSIPWIPIEPSEPVEPETPDNGGDNQTETPDTETLQTPVTETKRKREQPQKLVTQLLHFQSQEQELLHWELHLIPS